MFWLLLGLGLGSLTELLYEYTLCGFSGLVSSCVESANYNVVVSKVQPKPKHMSLNVISLNSLLHFSFLM
jgi:hypothetical protein